MSEPVYCRSCSELIDSKIIDDIHVDGFDDDDIVCQKCAKALFAFLGTDPNTGLESES